jgi:hypothetical protein
MIVLFRRQVSIMVLYAITLHLGWAWFLLRPGAADVLNVNAIHAIHQWPMTIIAGSAPALAAVIAGAALLALIGLLTDSPWGALLLIPQQTLLTFSAAGAIDSVFLGHFADGAPYPPDFIGADQLYSILAAIFHTMAIYAHTRRGLR